MEFDTYQGASTISRKTLDVQFALISEFTYLKQILLDLL
jgi:hypothetical protein